MISLLLTPWVAFLLILGLILFEIKFFPRNIGVTILIFVITLFYMAWVNAYAPGPINGSQSTNALMSTGFLASLGGLIYQLGRNKKQRKKENTVSEKISTVYITQTEAQTHYGLVIGVIALIMLGILILVGLGLSAIH